MSDAPGAERSWTLEVLAGRLSVCRIERGAAVSEQDGEPLWAVIRSPGETTLVAPEGEEPAGARVEPGWRALRVRGPLDFDLTGVLAELASALASARVPLFALSTYDTDLLLVREDALDDARRALEGRGHRVTGC